jgi:hypothetical protein
MARKTTKTRKSPKKVARKRVSQPKKAKRAKKPRRATAKKPPESLAAKVADALGGADLLRAWSPTRYSR